MSVEQLLDWIEACATMEQCVHWNKARRSWKAGREEAEAELARRGVGQDAERPTGELLTVIRLISVGQSGPWVPARWSNPFENHFAPRELAFLEGFKIGAYGQRAFHREGRLIAGRGFEVISHAVTNLRSSRVRTVLQYRARRRRISSIARRCCRRCSRTSQRGCCRLLLYAPL